MFKLVLQEGNKGKAMRSVNKVNKPSGVTVRKVGHWKDNQLVTKLMEARNVAIQQMSGNVSVGEMWWNNKTRSVTLAQWLVTTNKS